MTHHRLPRSVSEPFFFRSAWTRYWMSRRRELTSRIASWINPMEPGRIDE